MSFWGKLFGTDQALDEGAKIAHAATGGIIAGIDAAVYTKEENMRDIMRVLLTLQDQYTPRAISRRLIALLFSLVFAAYCMTALAVIVLRVYWEWVPAETIVALLVETATELYLPWIMLTIITFYFGYYGWQKVKTSKSG